MYGYFDDNEIIYDTLNSNNVKNSQMFYLYRKI